MLSEPIESRHTEVDLYGGLDSLLREFIEVEAEGIGRFGDSKQSVETS